jgi:hypothetical protein
MKKLAIVGAVLVALGLAASPGRAAAGSPQDARSAGDWAFLASLAAPEANPAPELAAKGPGPVTNSLCTVTASCGGTSISCSSNTSSSSCSGADRNCTAGERGHVTCNGVTTWCPTACGADCNTLFTQCENGCPNQCVKSFRCSPYSCVCGSPCI